MKFWNLLTVAMLLSTSASAQLVEGPALGGAVSSGGGGVGIGTDDGMLIDNCILVADGTGSMDCAVATYDDGFYDFHAGPPGYNWVALYSGTPDFDQDPNAGTFYLEGAYNGSEFGLSSGSVTNFGVDVSGAGITVSSVGDLLFSMSGGNVTFAHDDIGIFLTVEDDELLTFPRGWKIDEPAASTFFDIALAGTGTRNSVSVFSDISSWPEAGYLLVNNVEVMAYTKQNAFGVNITGRGKFGTTAVAHSNGVSVLPVLHYVALNDTGAPTEMIAGGGRVSHNAVPGVASMQVSSGGLNHLGHAAVGNFFSASTAMSTTRTMSVVETTSVAAYRNISNILFYTPGAPGQSAEALSSQAFAQGSVATNQLYSGAFFVGNASSALVSAALGPYARVSITSTGGITDAFGLLVDDPSVSGGGTITNLYGLFIDPQILGTSTNYAIHYHHATAPWSVLGDGSMVAGTSGAYTMSAAGAVGALSFTSSAASGANAFGASVTGARVDFGPGANDYAISNGNDQVQFPQRISAGYDVTAQQFSGPQDTWMVASPGGSDLTVKSRDSPGTTGGATLVRAGTGTVGFGGGTTTIAGGLAGDATNAGGPILFRTAAALSGQTLVTRLTIAASGAATFTGALSAAGGMTAGVFGNAITVAAFNGFQDFVAIGSSNATFLVSPPTQFDSTSTYTGTGTNIDASGTIIGAQTTTGTGKSWRIPTIIGASTGDLPACSSSTNAGQKFYSDDTDDLLSGVECICRANAAGVYSNVQTSDNITACIDPA